MPERVSPLRGISAPVASYNPVLLIRFGRVEDDRQEEASRRGRRRDRAGRDRARRAVDCRGAVARRLAPRARRLAPRLGLAPWLGGRAEMVGAARAGLPGGPRRGGILSAAVFPAAPAA